MDMEQGKESVTERVNQKPGPKPRIREDAVVAVNNGISIEIECTPQTREREAEAAFVTRMDGKGGVMAVNPVCGGSVYFKSMAEFPKVNHHCTCGNPKHFMVKYKFI